MPKKWITFSDLTGQMVAEGKEAKVVIKYHPMLSEPVEIEAGEEELKTLMADDSQYIIMDVTAAGETKQVITDLATFNALFADDPYAVLKDAKRVKTPKVTGKRSTSSAELAEIRAWATANGHEVSSKGRIAAPILEAYEAAHPAE